MLFLIPAFAVNYDLEPQKNRVNSTEDDFKISAYDLGMSIDLECNADGILISTTIAHDKNHFFEEEVYVIVNINGYAYFKGKARVLPLLPSEYTGFYFDDDRNFFVDEVYDAFLKGLEKAKEEGFKYLEVLIRGKGDDLGQSYHFYVQ